MTSRYCVTCKKTIRGHAIGAHIQHKHTVHTPSERIELVKQAAASKARNAEAEKKARAGIAALKEKFMDRVSPKIETLQPTVTEAIDKMKAAEAAHAERMLALHEKTLDVILALKDPQLAETAKTLIVALTERETKVPLWLMATLAGLTPALVKLANKDTK